MTKTKVEHLVPIVPGTLEAILDKQPGPNRHHKLTVTVEVEVEIDWKVEIVAATPSGMNPHDKLLRFDVVLPHGHHSNAIARRTVRYEESPPAAEYTSVLLEDGDQTTRTKVKFIV